MKLFFSKQSLSSRTPTETFRRIQEFLDRSQDGELFTITQIADAANTTANYLSQHFNFYLPEYKHVVRNRSYFGKPATIQQLKKETKR